MNLGKIFYYILWIPVKVTFVIAWVFDKTNWVIENLTKIAVNLHEDIKEL